MFVIILDLTTPGARPDLPLRTYFHLVEHHSLSGRVIQTGRWVPASYYPMFPLPLLCIEAFLIKFGGANLCLTRHLSGSVTLKNNLGRWVDNNLSMRTIHVNHLMPKDH